MIVLRAKTAGFCMGVARALRMLDAEMLHGGKEPIHTLGPIIHNPQVIEAYRRRGVAQSDRPEDIPAGGRVVVRAHGIPRPVQEDLERRGVRLVDATCPKVKKAQVLIAGQAALGRRLLLFGEEEHPEVRGLRSYAPENALVFQSVEHLKTLALPPDEPFFLAAQTTQDKAALQEAVAYLRDRLRQAIPVLDTICNATRVRQDEVVALAGQVQAVVVAGGLESGNTRRLAHVVRSLGVPCFHVESAADLPLDRLRAFERVGLTAGASTPRGVIDAIQAALEALDTA